MNTDFIVIGSGLAGLTSSLILAKYGKVLLVTKGKLSDGATNWAQGGIACVVTGDDSWQRHFEDTLIAGAYHNDKKAVEFLVKNASCAIDWLEKQGVPFEKSSGKYKTGREGGHSFNRIIHATDFTGKVIEMTLVRKVRENKNIEIWENSFVKELLIDKGCCIGVKIISNAPYSRFLHPRGVHPATPGVSLSFLCYGRVVVLATGGLGQIYQWTTNPYVATGDGIAMAYRAGAKLKDMEFVQFHPTALKHGKSPLFLLSEALRGEGAYLVKIKDQRSKIKNTNEKLNIKKTGIRFMGDYDSRMELAPRDIVARAIFAEQRIGYEVYLDIRHKGEKFIKERFPNIYKELKKRGFDLTADLIPVTPATHYCCGGVKTDLYGRTNIRSLFAFGEAACTGVHGANRLASNSLLEAVVFPLRLKECISGSSTIRGVEVVASPPRRCLDHIPHMEGVAKRLLPGESLSKVRRNVQQLMWEKVGIVRTREGLLEAKEKIAEWEKQLKLTSSIDREFLELINMLLVSKLIIESALRRTRSLGAHFMIYSKP